MNDSYASAPVTTMAVELPAAAPDAVPAPPTYEPAPEECCGLSNVYVNVDGCNVSELTVDGKAIVELVLMVAGTDQDGSFKTFRTVKRLAFDKVALAAQCMSSQNVTMVESKQPQTEADKLAAKQRIDKLRRMGGV